MKAYIASILICSLVFSTINTVLSANNFDEKQKSTIVNNLATALENRYVLVDEGKAFAKALISKNISGEFKTTKNKSDFVRQLNQSLRKMSKDLHLQVMPMSRQETDAVDENEKNTSLSATVLPGNVGLLTVNELSGNEQSVHKNMQKLANTDGLVIDVRSCPGGQFNMVSTLVSHFLAEGETIITYHTRGLAPDVSKSKPLPNNAARYVNKPVYVITSSYTGSGCEELSFDLKYHNLAYIIGETTAGAGFGLAGNPVDLRSGLLAFIPDTMPKHPKFNGGFEKVGVAPDIELNSNAALDRAYQLILSERHLADKNNKVVKKALLTSSLKTSHTLMAQAENNRLFREYLGSYGENKKLVFDDGDLKLLGAANMPLILEIKDNDLFEIRFTPGQMLRVNRNAKGAVSSISISTPRRDDWKTHERKKES